MLLRRNPDRPGARPSPRSWIPRIAGWSARHPWRATAAWFCFVAACLLGGATVGTHQATADDYRVGEAGHAETLAQQGGLLDRPTERVLITPRSGAWSGPRAAAAARDVTARMRALPEVAHVAAPVRPRDGRALMVAVTMNGAQLDAKAHADRLRTTTGAVAGRYPDLRVEDTGDASIGQGVDQQRGDDLALSEALTLPITLITLLLVFGSVLMAVVPLLLALSSIAGAMGIGMVVSHISPDAGVGNNIILLIGMAVGVDYTLFYLKREREERARAGDRLTPEALVDAAAATSGRMVVISGVAVAISTATLYLAGDVVFSSLATGAIVVTLVAVASSLTVLPALLALIGRRARRRAARRGPKRVTRRRTPRASAGEPGRVWGAVLRRVGRRPVLTLCLSLLVMLGLALPALGMNLRVLNSDSHSREIPAMRTYDRLTGAFPGLRIEHQIVVRAGAADAGRVRTALTDLARRTHGDPLLPGNTAARPRTSADHRTSTLRLSAPFKLSSEQARRSLDRLRADYVPATVGRISGADTAVTGDVAHDTDYLANQDAKLPLVIAALLLLTFAMTAVVFRSAAIALVGVALNLLSVAAALGVLVVFFQHGLASALFGIDPAATNAIGSRVPPFLIVILFGLSMDYQMFVVSRIRELVDRGVPAREAVPEGIARSAKVVTSAAVVMVTVFASFTFLHLAEMKQIGFCLAVGVLLDAFVIRALILPAAMRLLGRFAWWPSRVPRAARNPDQRAPLPELSR